MSSINNNTGLILEDEKAIKRRDYHQKISDDRKSLRKSNTKLRKRIAKINKKINVLNRTINVAQNTMPEGVCEFFSLPSRTSVEASARSMSDTAAQIAIQAAENVRAVNSGLQSKWRSQTSELDVAAFFEENVDTLSLFGTIVTNLTGAIVALSTANNAVEFAKVLFGLISQRIKQEHVQYVLESLAGLAIESDPDRINRITEDVIPEGTFDDVRVAIANFRAGIATPDSIPFFSVIRKVFSLTVFFGFAPSEYSVNESGLQAFFKSWEEKESPDFGKLQALDALLEIIEFGAEAADSIAAGASIQEVIFPSTIHNKYATIQKHEQARKAGTLIKNYSITSARHLSDINQLKQDLERVTRVARLPPHVRAQYLTYLTNISHLGDTVKLAEGAHTTRHQPLAVIFYGQSNIMKSEMMDMAIATYGSATPVPVNDELQYNVNEQCKRADGYHNGVTVIKHDDIANTKMMENNIEFSGPSFVIKNVNPMASMVPTAEASLKGTLFYNNLLYVGSTNKENIDAPLVSNRPRSVYRRLIFVEVKIKPEYESSDAPGEVDLSKLKRDATGMYFPAHTVQEYNFFEIPNSNGMCARKNLGPEMSIEDWFAQFAIRAKNWYETQEAYLKGLRERKNLPRCRRCHMPAGSSWCKCPKNSGVPGVVSLSEEDDVSVWSADELEDPVFHSVVQTLRDVGTKVLDIKDHMVNSLPDHLKKLAVTVSADPPVKTVDPPTGNTVVSESEVICREIYVNKPKEKTDAEFIAKYITSGKIMTSHTVAVLADWHLPVLEEKLTLFLSYAALKTVALFFTTDIKIQLAITVGGIYSVGFCSALAWEWMNTKAFCGFLLLQLLLIQQLMAGICTLCRRTLAKRITTAITSGINPPVILAAGTALAAFIGAVKAASVMAKVIPQGNLNPSSVKEVEKRNKETTDWAAVEFTEMRADHTVKTMTREQMVNNVRNNMVRFKFRDYSGIGILVDNSHLMLPYHTTLGLLKLDIEDYYIEILRNPKNIHNKCYTHMSSPKRIGESDFAVWSLEKTITCKPLEMYLPETNPTSGASGMFTLSAEGEFTEQKLIWKGGMWEVNDAVAFGSQYPLKNVTSNGDCMSMIVSENKPYLIYGFHLARSSEANLFGTTYGYAHTLTKEMIRSVAGKHDYEKIAERSRAEGVISGYNNSAIDGTPILNVNEIPHPDECIRYVDIKDGTPYVDYHGSDPSKRVTAFSRVKTHPIIPSLVKRGIEHKFDAPSFNANRNHSATFQKMIRGMESIEPSLLLWAQEDYLNNVLTKLENITYPRNKKPLTELEALNGVEGERYIKKASLKTSAGLGFNDQKIDHVEQLENGMYELTSLARADLEKLHSKLKNGVCPCPIVKSCLKDEPTDVSKTKRRIFAIFPFSHILLGKMLCAPVVAALYAIPLHSEMLQGCNVTTDEWSQIHDYILKHFPHKLAGDFSGYDIFLSGQLIRRAGAILSHIARFLGYSPEECEEIDVYVADLSHTFWLFNGTIMSRDGGNPSGNWLTICINGICNSLIHRAAFRAGCLERGLELKFNDHVRFGSVGDDSIGSTTQEWFNMPFISLFCKKYGLTYTDPWKGARGYKEFVTLDELEFCKRAFLWDEGLQVHLAPLRLESIYRMIMCYMQSKTSSMEIQIQNVRNALRELARHPRDVFDQNKKIVEEAFNETYPEWVDTIEEFSYSYDDWHAEFKKRYYPDDNLVEDNEAEIA